MKIRVNPWYETVEDIEKDAPDLLFEVGFGLEYN